MNPAVVAEWAKASVLIQVERHRRSQVQILHKVRFIRSKIISAFMPQGVESQDTRNREDDQKKVVLFYQ